MCHAGPCPPCELMGETQTCFCGKHTVTKRCSETEYGQGWSCEEPCGDLLSCGEHPCPRLCHSGLCGRCELIVPATCYCGKASKEIVCDDRGDVISSFNFGQLQQSNRSGDSDESASVWFDGSFTCEQEGGRQYDCR